ncbi:glycosyltransferase family 4 protein [Pelistega ratti]|uniref:glycosyltransferase family 4 protein n=1 Tax=Pelistega ratti TaxID=2652177 RepID=UPI001F47E0F4|nr:glycosyltransferase family 4 protein [Pelistega ratti]
MKILFLLSSLNAGGAERVACTLVNAWVEKGYEVVLIPCFSQGNGQSFYPLDPRVKVHWLANDLPRLKWLARIVKPWILRKLMRKEKADVMVSFLTNVNVISLMASKGLHIPLIVCERSDPSFQKISALLRVLRRYLYPQARVVMLQTEQAAQRFTEKMLPLAQISVVPNPLPLTLERISPNQQAPNIVLAMGRLVPSKQFDRLIQLYTSLADAFPDWVLHIYGEGPEKGALIKLIQDKGLQHKVFLKGKTNVPWEKMRQARILAMSSRLEGFPNVMLEAMACGLPVVCYDCPSGPREVSMDGTVAKLIPLNDEMVFQNALRDLMQNPLLREQFARQGQESVYARFSQEQVLQQWDTLLHEVIRKG